MPIYLLFLEFYLDYLSKAITCKAVGDQDGQRLVRGPNEGQV